MNGKFHGIRHFFAAFGYSMAGLRVALKETAIRHELALVLPHAILIVVLRVPFLPALVLSSLWVFVLVTELLNTALESAVDIASPDVHPLAKRAKDIGSAAVFCALVLFGTAWALVICRRYF